MPQFYSVGHSNRTLEEFTNILREAGIELLVDLRSFPRSRTNPVFNIDSLPDELLRHGIGYRHLRALGGRRPKQPGIDEQLNAMWRERSFHNYADYALGEEFSAAFTELVGLGRKHRLAVMCSEAVWWRCHRRIVVDYLLAQGHAVDHLMGLGKITHASMTPGARVTAERKVVYPAA